MEGRCKGSHLGKTLAYSAKVKVKPGDDDPLARLVALAEQTWGERDRTSSIGVHDNMSAGTATTDNDSDLGQHRPRATTGGDTVVPSGHGFSSRLRGDDSIASSDQAWSVESLERSVFVSHSRRDPASLNATFVTSPFPMPMDMPLTELTV